ncbi:hypothetical protein ABZW47_29640 [Streptomyces sp. NPDC004549]|uniref:hypothetical protein n=1 Tax=Streptomyces sp. NPDC004549 TaxID=3154283 RepID=UPI0033AB71E7
MVVHQPEPLWCCPLGLVMGAAYERAQARYDAAGRSRRDRDVRAAYAAMLAALVNWCEHQIDVHDADPGPDEQCPACVRLEGAPPVQTGSEVSSMTTAEWTYERRVHQVAHRLGPRIVTLMGEVRTEPTELVIQPAEVNDMPPAQ